MATPANTGGMGCYAPAPLLSAEMLAEVQARVLQPTLDGMRAQGSPYVGVLYAGLMVDGGQFRVIEFNCRFGDPEAQVILPLLETDLAAVILACLEGRLSEIELRWAPRSCVSVVLASGGYPGHYRRGDEIAGLEAAAALADTYVFHAGTRREGDRVLTAGGRVLDVTAWADDLPAAIERAYAAAALIHWPDCMMRHDIGAKAAAVAEGPAGAGESHATDGGER
jgi:phosphoribosylamine--glycine ligase